jgi:hypothetical protein
MSGSVGAIVANIFSAIAGVFSYLTGRSKEKNAPEIKKNDVAIKDQKKRDEIHKAVKNNDLETLRRLGSE